MPPAANQNAERIKAFFTDGEQQQVAIIATQCASSFADANMILNESIVKKKAYMMSKTPNGTVQSLELTI